MVILRPKKLLAALLSLILLCSIASVIFNTVTARADEGIAAIMVTSKTSGKKIMCERAMYWNNRGAGTDTIGGFSD